MDRERIIDERPEKRDWVQPTVTRLLAGQAEVSGGVSIDGIDTLS